MLFLPVRRSAPTFTWVAEIDHVVGDEKTDDLPGLNQHELGPHRLFGVEPDGFVPREWVLVPLDKEHQAVARIVDVIGNAEVPEEVLEEPLAQEIRLVLKNTGEVCRRRRRYEFRHNAPFPNVLMRRVQTSRVEDSDL